MPRDDFPAVTNIPYLPIADRDMSIALPEWAWHQLANAARKCAVEHPREAEKHTINSPRLTLSGRERLLRAEAHIRKSTEHAADEDEVVTVKASLSGYCMLVSVCLQIDYAGKAGYALTRAIAAQQFPPIADSAS